jgi:hypothetical protein
VLAYVEQHHRPVEGDGDVGDLGFGHLDVAHRAEPSVVIVFNSTSPRVRAVGFMDSMLTRPVQQSSTYPQFAQVHPQARSGGYAPEPAIL